MTRTADPPVEDEFTLKPVPQSTPTVPPSPSPSRPGRAFVPPSAPAPEPATADAFYGVRPTGAEEPDAVKPSWSRRFLNLFSDDEVPTADGSPEVELPLLRPVPMDDVES